MTEVEIEDKENTFNVKLKANLPAYSYYGYVIIENDNRYLCEILFARNNQIRKLDKSLLGNDQNIFDGFVLFDEENIDDDSDLENQKRIAISSWINLDDIWNVSNTDETSFWWVYKTADDSYKLIFIQVITFQTNQ